MEQSFIDKIKETQKGFIVINNGVALFANNSSDIQPMKIKESRDELIFSIHDIMELTVRSYPLDESNSAVIIIGKLEHTDNEIRLLKQLMYKVGIIPDENIIHSVIPRKKDIPTKRYDFDSWIEEKTKDFVGRHTIIKSIDDFVANNPRGYVIISAKPGMGKTALAAQLVKQRGYIHHFNIRAEGINKTSYFLTNICEQLISRYDLDEKYPYLPAEATQNSNFLSQLLDTISKTISDKIVIVVDGLDEVNDYQISTGINTLYLPTTLPPKVYIIATMRQGANVSLQTLCESKTIEIEPYSEYNRADITEYLKNKAKNQKIQEFILSQNINEEFFINHIFEKSEGNFVYLHYVLPDIENGIYDDMGFEKIPKGLLQYYEQHWQIMKGKDENSWFEYKLPVLVALTVTKRPISMNLISKFSKVEQLSHITQVLTEWKQFLYEENNTHNIQDKRYRLYHDNFHDFIASKDQVVSERVDLAKTERQIIDSLLPEGYGKGQTDNQS